MMITYEQALEKLKKYGQEHVLRFYDDFAAAQADDEAMEKIRAEFIKDYVEANGLNITAYQDYGWDPVMIN